MTELNTRELEQVAGGGAWGWIKKQFRSPQVVFSPTAAIIAGVGSWIG